MTVTLRRCCTAGFVLSVTLLTLAGCGTGRSAQDKAAARVVATEASLAATGKVILACYTVPACNKTAPRAQIKAAYAAAYDATVAAQAGVDSGATPDLTAMTAAMTALQGIVNQLPPT